MLKTQMSDRKSKLLDKSKILHDNTMDDKQVRNYIMSTLYAWQTLWYVIIMTIYNNSKFKNIKIINISLGF